MEIKVSKNLITLAKAFKKQNATLYIVGGFIRNTYFNLPSTDIDICSSLTPNKVLDICKTLNLKANIVNKKLGTVLIQTQTEKFEYTCFRTENYEKGGNHSPISTQFVDDIKLDASRRDFTINALYYNILTGEVLDFYNGLEDIKTKTLKAIKTPKEVFESDGLRILRLIRFAIEYQLRIDRKTLVTAKNYNFQLKDISKERILKELEAIVTADLKFNLNSKLTYEQLFNKLELYQYIFNSSFKKFKIKYVSDKKYITKENRYLNFAMQILSSIFNNRPQPKEQIEFQIHRTFGEDGLKDSNEHKQNFLTLYYIYQFNLQKNLKSLNKDRNKFLDIITSFNKLSDKNLDFIKQNSQNIYGFLISKTKEFKEKNIPLSQEELNISNQKLIEIGTNPKLISKIRTKLFVLCLNEKTENKEEQLLKIVKELNSASLN